MLKKHTKHTGHTQLQLDYHYKTTDFKKSKGEKNSFEKSQDSRRVLVCSNEWQRVSIFYLAVCVAVSAYRVVLESFDNAGFIISI